MLPSATELLFALGAGDDVVGVTFECDYPPEARTRRIVSTSALPEGLPPGEIDRVVSERMAAGEDLYRLDAGALRDLDADLVVTQDLCAVCAVDVSVVDEALAYLGCRAQVLTLDPHTLDEVIGSVVTLGEAVGRTTEAAALTGSLRDRLDRVVPAGSTRALVLEWTDPPFAPGHWVPDMVTSAGGVPVLGMGGEKSYRVDWAEVGGCDAEVVVVAPCGFGLADSARLGREVLDRLPPGVPMWAVDANASFARPGPRLVDGVEALAAIMRGDEPDPAIAARLTAP